MKSKALYLIYIFPILFLLSLAACDDMDDYSSDPKHTLWFSQDTLRMDTVLTGIPTSTRQLKVYNPHKKALLPLFLPMPANPVSVSMWMALGEINSPT